MAGPTFIPTPQEQRLLEEECELPLGYCLRCHKEVITHLCLGEGVRRGQLVRRCVFCDDEILEDEAAPTSASVADLSRRGYRIVAPEASRLQKEGGASDGGGCGTCSKDGCGS